MKRKEYSIKIYSWWRFIIFFTLIFCLLNLLLLENQSKPIESIILFLIQGLSTLIIAFYLSRILSEAKVKITLTEQGYEHRWERRFLLSREKGVRISWNLIENYVFQQDRAFDNFILNLTGERRYQFDRLNITNINDDFNALLADFSKFANSQKGSNTKGVLHKIKRGKTIYEKLSFQWVVYLYGVFFIILLVTKIIDPVGGTPWGPLGVIGSTFFFYAWMIYSHAKKQ